MNDWRTTSALLAGIAVLAAGAPTPARAQQEPEVLKRTTKWIARFDKDACHLVAQFGDGESSVVAFFTQYRPGVVFDLDLVGKRFLRPQAEMDVRIDFGIGSDQGRNAMLGKMGDTPAVFLTMLRLDGLEYKEVQSVSEVTPEVEERVTGLTFRLGKAPPLRLETGSLGKPFATMRQCTSNLVKSWGYDPAVQEKLSRRASPRTPAYQWIDNRDYPTAALRARLNGLVKFRLEINAEGGVSGCHVLASTSPDEFSVATCKAISSRASFEPALDADGKPVGSYYVAAVRFQTAEVDPRRW